MSLTATVQVSGLQDSWDVMQARGQTRQIDFTTTEGTWMSVDLAPDGQWIAFDLLGHVYRMSSSGGEAQSLTQGSGVAVNYHPRISPDGRHIAFVSDRGGMDNLWIMNADGSSPRIVASDQNSRAVTPAWTPDGQYIVVRKENIGRGAYGEAGHGIWMYHRDGGRGIQLVGEGNAHWPTVSPDGRFVFYHSVRGGRDRDALKGDYQLHRVEMATGTVIDITSGTHGTGASGRRSSGGAFAPEISPDGRWLAFGRHIPDGLVTFKGHRFGPRTALWLLNLETGEEILALDPVNPAVESGDKNLRVLPGYSWSRDGRSILINVGGGIGRFDVASRSLTQVPFQARVQRTASQQAYTAHRIEDGPFQARFLRWQTASPSGNLLAFQAIGRVWLTDLPSGTPQRLTRDAFEPGGQEFGPAWSPDGQWVAFTTWDDALGGHVWKAQARAGATPVRLTTQPGEYVHPAWSPDGREVVVALGSGATRRGRTVTHNPWWDLVRISSEPGAAPQVVTRVALPSGSGPEAVQRRAIVSPHWGPDGRIFFPDFVRGGTALTSVRPDGTGRQVHAMLGTVDEAAPSPDGRWIAFQEADNIYVTPMLASIPGEPLGIDRSSPVAPIRQLSRTGGMFLRWRDNTTVEFGNADQYIRHDVAAQTADTFNVRLMVPRRAQTGSMALTNARIVTLAGPNQDEVLDRGTIVVRGRRITCVGACDTAGIDQVIDASGATVIPGFIDMHSHGFREHRGYRPLRDYEAGIYLAHGITTRLDNSMWSQNIFPTAELVEAGRMIGSRTFSTGDPLPFEELSDREATWDHIAKVESWGAVSLKQHSHPRRDRRQWIADIARERGVMATAEGYDLEYNIGMALDGYTAWEHPLSVIPLYSDVAQFFSQAQMVYSNPFMYNSSTAYNIEYWYGESDVWKDEMQRRWMPWRMDTFLRRRWLRPETDYSFPMIAQGLADLVAAGGHVALGGHGEHHALSMHWEVWMAASGMGPLGALRAASAGGAYFLGATQDVGSLEVGKLADLMVLNSNPLEEIRNTLDIRYVLKEGILYEGGTLDEIWPERHPFGPYYWTDEDAQRQDERSLDGWRSPGR